MDPNQLPDDVVREFLHVRQRVEEQGQQGQAFANASTQEIMHLRTAMEAMIQQQYAQGQLLSTLLQNFQAGLPMQGPMQPPMQPPPSPQPGPPVAPVQASPLPYAPLKMERPPQYSGASAAKGKTVLSVRAWAFSVQNYLDMTAPQLAEADRVRYAAGLLTGEAANWWYLRTHQRGFLAGHIGSLSPDEALDRFMRGLKSDVYKYVAPWRPRSVTIAAEIAGAYDGSGKTPKATNSEPTPMELNQLRADLQAQINSLKEGRPKKKDTRPLQKSKNEWWSATLKKYNLTEQVAKQLMADGKCFKCKQNGHRVPDCPN